MATSAKTLVSKKSSIVSIDDVSPVSKELVIALSGLAGAGCSSIADQMDALLDTKSYEVHLIKVSDLICEKTNDQIPEVQKGGGQRGLSKLNRAVALQNAGDRLRETIGDYALSSFVVEKIKALRGSAAVGHKAIAYIIDSLKHPAEVDLLRKVYGSSFKLLAVHCDVNNRERRLIGVSPIKSNLQAQKRPMCLNLCCVTKMTATINLANMLRTYSTEQIFF